MKLNLRTTEFVYDDGNNNNHLNRNQRTVALSTGLPGEGTEKNPEQLTSKVKKLIQSRKFSKSLLDRLELINRHGAPPMRVLPLKKLKELKRFPKSDEGLTVDAMSIVTQCMKMEVCPNFYFLSHRWCLNAPDDVQDTQARMLCRYFEGLESDKTCFLWIDFPCMEQLNESETQLYIRSLPLYVACCTEFITIGSLDLENRAWIQVERVMAFAFLPNVRMKPIVILDRSGALFDKFTAESSSILDKMVRANSSTHLVFRILASFFVWTPV